MSFTTFVNEDKVVYYKTPFVIANFLKAFHNL